MSRMNLSYPISIHRETESLTSHIKNAWENFFFSKKLELLCLSFSLPPQNLSNQSFALATHIEITRYMIPSTIYDLLYHNTISIETSLIQKSSIMNHQTRNIIYCTSYWRRKIIPEQVINFHGVAYTTRLNPLNDGGLSRPSHYK